MFGNQLYLFFGLVSIYCYGHVEGILENEFSLKVNSTTALLTAVCSVAALLVSVITVMCCLFYKRKTFHVTQLNFTTSCKTVGHVEPRIFSVRPTSQFVSNGFERTKPETQNHVTNGTSRVTMAKETTSKPISHFDSTTHSDTDHVITLQKEQQNSSNLARETSLIEPDDITVYTGNAALSVDTPRTGSPIAEEQIIFNHSKRESVISLIPPDEITTYNGATTASSVDMRRTCLTIMEDDQEVREAEKQSTTSTNAPEVGNNMASESLNPPEYSIIDKTRKKSNSKESISDVIENENSGDCVVPMSRESVLSIEESFKPEVPPKTPESRQFVD